MKLMCLVFFVFIYQVVIAQQIDGNSKANRELYAVAVNIEETNCYSERINILKNLLRQFPEYHTAIDKQERYSSLKNEFSYLEHAKIDLDALNDTYFRAQELNKFLKKPVKFTGNCEQMIAFSPVIYNSDRTKAFFITYRSSGEIAISESGYTMTKDSGKWKLFQKMVLYFF